MTVFKDEMKKKMSIKNEVLPFTLTMLSRSKMMLSGVKNVMLSNDNALKFRLSGGSLTVSGENLQIIEIGGGDVYIHGIIGGVQFE